jgi:hypothetical protein
MDLTPGQRQYGFTIETHEQLAEIDGSATVMRHESGARLLFLKNEDNDKAFSIGFKTPPVDDTGVFHILEHSVLCGSDKFPVKEPFVNLLKSSMQTFLNAMTFADKTVYPVSSTNEKDLMNLMDVYLDAVFHPAIYSREAIFQQEGWHYELENAQAPLTYNGVVFNEMKGVMSDPDNVLYDTLQASLFPNTAYRYESGGLPSAIPALSYEDFLDNHARHYQLENSYITLYGNLNIDTVLEFLDSKYLSPVASEARKAGAPNMLEYQAPVEALDVQVEMATSPENACAGLGYVIGTAADHERIVAVDILMDALMGSNEAPLKKALLEAGFAGDVFDYMNKSILQPFLLIEAKGIKPGCAQKFQACFEENVRTLCESGIDKQLIEGAIAHAEFVMREGDFGTSTGVVLAINSLASWLYDDSMAIDPLRYESLFTSLREKLNTGYFEQLLEEVILKNNHRALVEVVPTEQESSEEATRLAAIKETLSKEQIEGIIKNAEDLHRAQMEPDSPEALASLPLLELEDIAQVSPEAPWHVDNNFPQTCLVHEIPTHGIDYLTYYFSLDQVTYEELPYVSVLATLLGKLDTTHYSAAEIDTLTQLYLGRFRFSATTYENAESPQGIEPKFIVSTSALSKNLEYATSLPQEIWANTRFDDPERIKTILQQQRIGMEQNFSAMGHTSAIARVAAGLTYAGKLLDELSGVGFYHFLCDLLDNFDTQFENLVSTLQSLCKRIFTTSLVVSFTGETADLSRVWELGGTFNLEACNTQAPRTLVIEEPVAKNEAFIVPSDVCYVGAGCNRSALDAPSYNGATNIASRVLSYDYLWNEVRVKGGAYGAGYKATRSGTIMFYSFRDPNLDNTVSIYENTGAWLSHFSPTEEELRGYIISAVASHDAPCKPRQLAARQNGRYFSNLPENYRETLRNEMLSTTLKQLQEGGRALEHLKENQVLCVFGNKEKIEASGINFEVKQLY